MFMYVYIYRAYGCIFVVETYCGKGAAHLILDNFK